MTEKQASMPTPEEYGEGFFDKRGPSLQAFLDVIKLILEHGIDGYKQFVPLLDSYKLILNDQVKFEVVRRAEGFFKKQAEANKALNEARAEA